MATRPTKHHSTNRPIAQTLDVYRREAETFLTRWGKGKYKRPPLINEWLQMLPKGSRLLDLGCGAGQDTRYLRSIGHHVIGLDHTLPLLAFASRRSSTLPYILGDIRTLPIANASMDGVWAAASLIHLPKPVARQVFAELAKCVRPGGLFAATITQGRSSGIKTKGWLPGRYFVRWQKDELAGALHRAGWKVLSLRVVHNRERKGRWINVIARSVRVSGTIFTHEEGLQATSL